MNFKTYVAPEAVPLELNVEECILQTSQAALDNFVSEPWVI